MSEFFVRLGKTFIGGKWRDVSSSSAPIALPPPSIGDVADDGYICFAQSGDQMLLTAPASQRQDFEWGSHGTERGTTSTTDGYSNTNTLQAYGSSAHPAAHYCWNNSRNPIDSGGGGTGSYLPAENELQLIYNNRSDIDSWDTSGSDRTLGNIQSGAVSRPNAGGTVSRVWSSTESSSNAARRLRFINGIWSNDVKSTSYWVCPLRRVDA